MYSVKRKLVSRKKYNLFRVKIQQKRDYMGLLFKHSYKNQIITLPKMDAKKK